MLIRHLSLRLLFTNVAIDTNDECLVLDIIFSAVFFLNYNDKKNYITTVIDDLLLQ